MNGHVITIILLVPIFFQVAMLASRQTRRHQEILQRLGRLEETLRCETTPKS